MGVAEFMEPIRAEVVVGGESYSLVTPRWGTWLEFLDTDKLVETVLQKCVLGPKGNPLLPSEIAKLEAETINCFLERLFALMEHQRCQLEMLLATRDNQLHLRGIDFTLQLRPWSFGERNQALQRSLRLQAGWPVIDFTSFETEMVLTCVTYQDGSFLELKEISNWPVPLGEAVIQRLTELNGPENDYEEILGACLERGLSHPDLDIITLCQAFSWQPQQVEKMDANLVERLLACLRLGQGERKTPLRPPATSEEGVRILVVDE